MKIKVSGCNIKQSGITLTIDSTISSHCQTWFFDTQGATSKGLLKIVKFILQICLLIVRNIITTFHKDFLVTN